MKRYVYEVKRMFGTGQLPSAGNLPLIFPVDKLSHSNRCNDRDFNEGRYIDLKPADIDLLIKKGFVAEKNTYKVFQKTKIDKILLYIFVEIDYIEEYYGDLEEEDLVYIASLDGATISVAIEYRDQEGRTILTFGIKDEDGDYNSYASFDSIEDLNRQMQGLITVR